jgi:hypothetical protein
MSVFRDDIGIGNVQERVFSLVTTKNTKTTDAQNSQNTENLEPESFEKIDLTTNTQKRQETSTDPLEKMQEDKNLLETTNNSLSSIKDSLENIASGLKERLSDNFDESKTGEITDSVKKDLQNIKDTIDNTSFNGKTPLDADSSDKSETNSENSSIIDTLSSFKDDSSNNLNLENIDDISLEDKERVEEFQKKVGDQIAYIERKHKECLEFEDKIVDKVDSLIEFDSQLQKSPDEISKTGTQLKETAVKSISENPETCRKAQIIHLDEKILLGLLSITRT